MIDFIYSNPTTLVLGKDAIEQTGGQAALYAKSKTAMLVYGGSPEWNPKTTGLLDAGVAYCDISEADVYAIYQSVAG